MGNRQALGAEIVASLGKVCKTKSPEHVMGPCVASWGLEASQLPAPDLPGHLWELFWEALPFLVP